MDLSGPLAPNSLLNGAEKLFKGLVVSPEGLATANGTLYTSTRGGDIVKIVGDKLVLIANIGHTCGNDFIISWIETFKANNKSAF
jgi:Adipocyte plasma membrane-associated protein-like, N-terminal